MKKVSVLFLAMIFCFSNLELLGWGQTGHRVVGAIAQNHLSKKAKKNIEKLLGKESLAIASTWMDEIKSDSTYDHTHDWHWVSVSDKDTYDSAEKNPNGDLVEAIERMKTMLKSDTVSGPDKIHALRYLVHLVGDLHQPLHVGTGLDRGGNDVKLKWFNEASNLHRVWDSEIIDSKQLSYTEIVCAIDTASQDLIKKWQSGTTKKWAEEAKQYREQIYDLGGKDRIGYEYMYQNWDLVQQQLLKGGIRLAAVLNEIFG